VALALGIDVGSTTVKVVAVDERARLRWAASARHAGRPFELVATLRRAAEDVTGATRVGYTGTLGVALAAEAGGIAVSDVHSVALAVGVRAPSARTIIELGGQDAKVVWLDRDAARAEMNDRCAAGTGATLDRIARRLALTEAEVRGAAPRGELCVAARCGVFAESAAVDLVQRGASRTDVFGAVVRGVVAQCLSALMKGRLPEAPVVLLGGPHMHVPALALAWGDALRDVWARELTDDELTVPAAAHLFGAIGAALHVLRGGGSLAPARSAPPGESRALPLVENDSAAAEIAALSEVLRAGMKLEAPRRALRAVHVGLDVGTTTAKAVAIDGDGCALATSCVPSTGDPLADSRAVLAQLGGVAREVTSFGVTGCGAALVGEALGATREVVELDALARGARALAPDTDVVVDVGGTDVKVLCLRSDGGGALYVSNRCAAGQGAFVAATAAEFGIAPSEMGAAALSAARAPRFAHGCATFMDTDRVSFQREGHTPAEILAGLSSAVAGSVWEQVVGVPPGRLGERFLLTGGAHRNVALAWAQIRHLRACAPGVTVRLAPAPELVGALGAALLARDEPATSRAPR
jgi:predicted CoA-substrate-specific enzyme activase